MPDDRVHPLQCVQRDGHNATGVPAEADPPVEVTDRG